MKLTVTDLPYLSDTSALLGNIQKLGGICALESASQKNEEGRWSILCAQPYSASKTDLALMDQDYIETLLNKLPHSNVDLPFTGGVIGHATYGANNLETTSGEVVSSLYTWAYLIDHLEEKAYLAYWDKISKISEEELINLYKKDSSSKRPFEITKSFTPVWSKKDYKSKIDQIHQYIISGDVYQVNLAQKFTATYSGADLEAYKKLKDQSHSPFLTYFEFNKISLASVSPELFIKIEGDRVSTKPIKGTVSRSENIAQDNQNIRWLKASQKDHAENIMITDLLRNDLSINCKNIKVPKLCNLESFETVHHLVSTVTAKKNKEASPFKVFRDAFPGGSITGAPKKRAMEIINELEEGSRNFYCGSSFYYSTNKNFSSNILIRSFVFEGGNVSCWAGGGITIDSTWEAEYKESLDKISKLMRALES